MVLHSLGLQLTAALQKLNNTTVVDDEAVKGVINDIAKALLSADVNIKLVKRLKDNVLARVTADEETAYSKAKLVERAVMEELVSMLDPGKEPYKPKKGKPNVIMFVGLQGAGKTTTVAKYAHYYQQRKWKVAMVCADTFRAGAFDQLKQNATRVRVPFYGSYTEPDPVKIAAEGVAQFRKEGYEIIIVDTSGRHKQEAALFEEMEGVYKAVNPNDIVFVMDSTIGQAAEMQAAAFKSSVPVGSVIITKLDGHAKGGGALSAVAATGSPIVFVGSGEHFDDLQAFDAHAFIGKLLGRGDMRGLMADMKEKGVLADQEALLERMGKGKFTYRDMYEQFAGIMKLGPLGKVMEMLPGSMGSMMSGLTAAGGDPGHRLKRFCHIMQSMTKKELDCVTPLDDSRLSRIARGAGVHPQEVLQLMQTHRQMEKMVTGMSKAGLLQKNDKAVEATLKRNPGAVAAAMQKSMDPAMLKTMGGMDNVMRMMREMGGMPGMPTGGAGTGGRGGGGGGGGGMPSMDQMRKMMKGMGLG